MTSSVNGRGWTRVAFGDVVRQVRDLVNPEESGLDRYVAGEHMDTDDLRIRRWGTIGNGYLGPAFHMRFKPGHVLYGSRRTYLRKVAVADFEGITANTTFVMETKDANTLLPDLLPFVMQTESFHAHSIGQSKGSVNPYINFSDLTWYEFDLPPLEEQRRIAQALGAFEAAIDAHLHLAASAETVYDTLLSGIFSTYANSLPAPGGKDSSSVPIWRRQRVDECFELQLGKMSSKKAREGKQHTPYVKNTNVLWDGFSLNDLPTMSFSEAERSKFSLCPGDLLVCEGGEIGRAAIWHEVGSGIVYQKALHRLRPKDGSVLPRFLLHYLRYCASAGELVKIATGTTILHLPQERLAALGLPFPDVGTQASLVSKFDEAQRAAAEARKNTDRLKSIKLLLIQESLRA